MKRGGEHRLPVGVNRNSGMPNCSVKGVRYTIEGHIPGGRESGWVGQWNRLVVGRFLGMAGMGAKRRVGTERATNAELDEIAVCRCGSGWTLGGISSGAARRIELAKNSGLQRWRWSSRERRAVQPRGSRLQELGSESNYQIAVLGLRGDGVHRASEGLIYRKVSAFIYT